jgi:hypothetical protein
MAALLDQIASVPDQPLLSPVVIICLLKRIFGSPDSLLTCSPDEDVDTTIYYFGFLESLRKKRIKALEMRRGQVAVAFVKTAPTNLNRYNFAMQGIKLWVCHSI